MKRHGIRPSKKLSQNFVVNPRLISDILSLTSSEDTVEIGCGIGTLTIFLINRVRSLACVEYDERMIRVVASIVRNPRFIPVRGDALATGVGRPQVVSNLPYHVTSDMLIMIARDNSVSKAVLTLQKEVGDRLVAKPGSESYGRLSVIVQLLFNLRVAGVYHPGSFIPRPKVASSLLLLERRRTYDRVVEKVEHVTRALFSQRRRNARRVAESRLSLSAEVLNRIIPSDKRVFELEPEVFLALAEELAST
ncbi:MAG: 16S rRNA (adenine(1518)-N(6)/adenine(1519)-N(6))-dimethyltransferase RsmA [Thermosphaera sp.]|uniref:16S rRNA (adenine(1518)-N(6)/adenine(1519)-N(6))- dimethyltransferase RsmA n=1 Tax=Thermosphaera chiliense TaxID=3402707 RepID=UPI001D0A54B2|nr:16S rRNA (adenine(1518)-N(6)/adenine(1519)-N(6))-dimethyltransferase RsmA [Thermosphaera aggregans]